MTLIKQQKIRILHVLFVLDSGGIEKYLIDVLRHIDRDRFHLDFVAHVIPAASPYIEEIRSLGSQVILCPDPRQNLRHPWQYIHAFNQILRQYGPYDIIHSHTGFFDGVVLRLASKAGIPIRITHTHTDTAAIMGRGGFVRRIYYTLMKSWVNRYATVGLGMRQNLIADMFGLVRDADPRWQVIEYGIDLTAFQVQIDRTMMRNELGIPQDAFVIGHVGRFSGEKNHQFILDVAAQTIQREPKMYLLLVGDGSQRPTIEQKAVKLGLSDRVIFTGVRSDIAQLMLGAMDVFLFPSLYEALGFVRLEAQACGLPCIVSDTVPEEGDVVKSLVQRISLSQPASVWSEMILNTRHTKARITQSEALDLVKQSRFNIQNCIKNLEKLYLKQLSVYQHS